MNVSDRINVIIADEQTPTPAPTSDDPVVQPAPLDTHPHEPVQHRDGKQPWCADCGLTVDGLAPTPRRRTVKPPKEA